MLQKADISKKYKGCSKKGQPYKQGLLEIFPEGPEKGLCGSVHISFDGAEHTVIERRQRRADGHDWKAAQDKQQICQHDVPQLIQENMDNIIFVEEIHGYILSGFFSLEVL